MSIFTGATVIMGAVTETESLRETVLKLLELCDHRDLREIIIGCSQHVTPESKAAANEMAALNTDVPIVVFMQKRPGLSGFLDAIEITRGSHCIPVASDMALDLTCVPEMIRRAKEEPDTIVSTSRWMKGCTFYEYSRVRRILNKSAQLFLRLLFHTELTDLTNPCQIAPTELYRSIRFENEGFPFLLEVVLKPLRLGYRFEEIPTNCYSRKEGRSNNSIRQTAMYLPTALHIRLMKKKDILKSDSKLYQNLFG